jgi:microcystin-dependent protein
MYVVNNACGDAVTVKVSGQTGVTVPAGKTMLVFNNGTDVVSAVTHLASTTLTTPLAASSGGTGLTSPGTSGNVLTSNGSTWASNALPQGFPSGGIIMWSGSIATIPSGWALCNGSNGTPDLRDRFVVGAGSNYAVAASGGSADAVVVSHTHTGTTESNGNHSHTVTTYYKDAGTKSVSDNGGVFQEGTFTSTTSTAGAHTHTFTTASAGVSGTNANLPPYYALCYIMKL